MAVRGTSTFPSSILLFMPLNVPGLLAAVQVLFNPWLIVPHVVVKGA